MTISRLEVIFARIFNQKGGRWFDVRDELGMLGKIMALRRSRVQGKLWLFSYILMSLPIVKVDIQHFNLTQICRKNKIRCRKGQRNSGIRFRLAGLLSTLTRGMDQQTFSIGGIEGRKEWGKRRSLGMRWRSARIVERRRLMQFFSGRNNWKRLGDVESTRLERRGPSESLCFTSDELLRSVQESDWMEVRGDAQILFLHILTKKCRLLDNVPRKAKILHACRT